MTSRVEKTSSHRMIQPTISNGHWKVGMDIGTCVTAYQEAVLKGSEMTGPRGFLFPTVVGYPRGSSPGGRHNESIISIGQDALRRYSTLEIVEPLRLSSDLRRRSLLDFARRFRKHMGTSRKEDPWGVISYPSYCDSSLVKDYRSIANELFERTMLVDEAVLMSMGMVHELGTRCAMFVDIGAASTRLYLLTGDAPVDDGRLVIPHGGRSLDTTLRSAFRRKFPDLLLTDITVTRIKEQLGFVRPRERRCTLKVHFGGTTRSLDVTDIISESCEMAVEAIRGGIRKMLSRCPSDALEYFIGNIFLLGGGARLRGLRTRLQNELRQEGLDLATVRHVPSPQSLTASGALKWALAAKESHWEVPLFSFR